MVTHLRFVSHILVALLFGGLNYQIGNDASKADQNVSFVFLSILFLVSIKILTTFMENTLVPIIVSEVYMLFLSISSVIFGYDADPAGLPIGHRADDTGTQKPVVLGRVRN